MLNALNKMLFELKYCEKNVKGGKFYLSAFMGLSSDKITRVIISTITKWNVLITTYQLFILKSSHVFPLILSGRFE